MPHYLGLILLISQAHFLQVAGRGFLSDCRPPGVEQPQVILEASLVANSGQRFIFKVNRNLSSASSYSLSSEPSKLFYLRLSLPPACSRGLHPGQKYYLFLSRGGGGGGSASGVTPHGFPLLKSDARSKSLVNEMLCASNGGPLIRKLSSNSSSDKVSEGHLLRLKCRISSCGSKRVDISWLKNGRLLKATRRLHIKDKRRGSVLYIRHAREADRGRYECRISSSSSSSSSSSKSKSNSRNRDSTSRISLRIRVLKKRRTINHFDSKRFLRGSVCPISSYCLNGGKCVYYRGLGELTCICATGFKGKRCEHKDLYDRAVTLNNHPRSGGLSLACVLGVTHYPC